MRIVKSNKMFEVVSGIWSFQLGKLEPLYELFFVMMRFETVCYVLLPLNCFVPLPIRRKGLTTMKLVAYDFDDSKAIYKTALIYSILDH